jgi:hypothetical protein
MPDPATAHHGAFHDPADGEVVLADGGEAPWSGFAAAGGAG